MSYLMKGLGCNCENGTQDGTGRPAGLGCPCNDKPLGLGVTIPNSLIFGPAGFLYDTINSLSDAIATPATAMTPEVEQVSNDTSSIPTWAWVAGGLGFIWFLSGHTQKRRARRRIYNDYNRRLDEADTAYTTKTRIKRIISKARRKARRPV